jgi:hypothetical protein
MELLQLKEYLNATLPATFIDDNMDSANRDEENTFVVQSTVQLHRRMRLGRKEFKSFNPGRDFASLEASKLPTARDCFAEFRSLDSIHEVEHLRCPVALICKIFSWSSDNLSRTKRCAGAFIICRDLQPYTYPGIDPYGWQRL